MTFLNFSVYPKLNPLCGVTPKKVLHPYLVLTRAYKARKMRARVGSGFCLFEMLGLGLNAGLAGSIWGYFSSEKGHNCPNFLLKRFAVKLCPEILFLKKPGTNLGDFFIKIILDNLQVQAEKCGLRAWRAGKSPCGLAGLRARA